MEVTIWFCTLVESAKIVGMNPRIHLRSVAHPTTREEALMLPYLKNRSKMRADLFCTIF